MQACNSSYVGDVAGAIHIFNLSRDANSLVFNLSQSWDGDSALGGRRRHDFVPRQIGVSVGPESQIVGGRFRDV